MFKHEKLDCTRTDFVTTPHPYTQAWGGDRVSEG